MFWKVLAYTIMKWVNEKSGNLAAHFPLRVKTLFLGEPEFFQEFIIDSLAYLFCLI